MFKQIVVPLDGSALAEVALPHAAALAEATDAKVVLLHVLEPGSSSGQRVATDPLNWHLLKAEARSYLEDVSERLHQHRLSVDTVLLEGRAAERITEFIRDSKADVVVLSSHGRSGLSRWNVSSVVQKIILRASISAMIVRAYDPPEGEVGELRYRRIVAPMDGSRRAEVVLPLVHTLANWHKAEALLINVVTRPEMPRRAPLSPEDAALADKVVERNSEEGERYLSQLKSRLNNDVQTRLLVGKSVSTTLHEFIDTEAVDLVVLSAHGYSGDSTRPYGTLVTSLIAYGSTPLLIVQDLAIEEIEPTEAELAATKEDAPVSGERGRSVVHARVDE